MIAVRNRQAIPPSALPSSGPKGGSEGDQKGRRNFKVSARRHAMQRQTKGRGLELFCLTAPPDFVLSDTTEPKNCLTRARDCLTVSPEGPSGKKTDLPKIFPAVQKPIESIQTRTDRGTRTPMNIVVTRT